MTVCKQAELFGEAPGELVRAPTLHFPLLGCFPGAVGQRASVAADGCGTGRTVCAAGGPQRGDGPGSGPSGKWWALFLAPVRRDLSRVFRTPWSVVLLFGVLTWDLSGIPL